MSTVTKPGLTMVATEDIDLLADTSDRRMAHAGYAPLEKNVPSISLGESVPEGRGSRPAVVRDDGTIRARVEAAVPKDSATKLTYDDYVLFPDDGLRHEIIEGEHYVSPSPSMRHQRILFTLSYLLRHYLETHPIGEAFFAPFDVLLSEFNVLVPDLIYLSNERSHLLTSKNLQGSPDLVVEILSPSTRSRDKRLKRDVYERTGVGEYWVIDPDEDIVDVYRRGSEGAFTDPIRFERTGSVTTSLLPGLELPLEKLFA